MQRWMIPKKVKGVSSSNKSSDNFSKARLKKLLPNYITKKQNNNESDFKFSIIKSKKRNIKSNDIAVIIGNKNYDQLGNDIPNVVPAYNDAIAFKQYFIEKLGIQEDNIIFLKDATGSQLISIFGNQNSHKGKLFNWILPNKSNVHIFQQP